MIHLKVSRKISIIRKIFQISPEKFMPHLSLKDDERLLEFGCGAGLASSLFSPHMYVGVDIDDQRIAYAKGMNQGYKFFSIKGTPLPFKDNEFDKILALSVFHHIGDSEIASILSELARVLKPGKFLVTVEPHLTTSRWHNSWMNSIDQGRFIRQKRDYLSLFGRHFDVEVVEDFTTPMLFKQSIYRLQKRQGK